MNDLIRINRDLTDIESAQEYARREERAWWSQVLWRMAQSEGSEDRRLALCEAAALIASCTVPRAWSEP